MKELTPGLELGARFVLVRRIGRGGSAEVWLADDRARGAQVALKFFPESFAADAPRLARLESELLAAHALPPEHFVRLDGVERVDGHVFLVMEFLEGGDLGQLRGRSFASWATAVDDVAAALEALHARGLVHRDLKPANVFLDGAGRARLGDLGLTALAGAAPEGGSPYNASPQQLRGEPAAPADDLYALGALLYELIAGHPPYYPDITRDRVLQEPVPPLLPRGEVPVAVRELALRLLSKAPENRPAGVREVRRVLAAPDAGNDAVQPLINAWPGVAAPAPPRRNRFVPAAFAAVALAAIAAFLWLQPRLAGEGSAIVADARRQAEAASADQRSRAERQASEATLRDAAEAARGKFESAFKSLDGRAAARWATTSFAEARDAGAEAARLFASADPAAAAERWNAGSGILAGIEKQAPAALAAAVKAGQDALAAGRTEAARESFGRALAIQPNHPPATAGLARAQRLDEALALADAARKDEQAGRLSTAEAGYRKALATDPSVPGAQAGLERLAASRNADAFSVAMSRGFAESAAGRADSARAAFNQALAIRPASREARDAIASIDQGERASALEVLVARARAAESEERWDEALTAWREAAGLEPTLESAREGLTRATPRAELQRRIDALNANPERLWDPAGRAEAKGLVATAAATGNPRERLAASARELERIAAAAVLPVQLRLESDGQTQVVIYRVGQYGAFATREVKLLPGRYTVVGTRTGYRDVRREVVLPPGTGSAAVVVRCEEPI